LQEAQLSKHAKSVRDVSRVLSAKYGDWPHFNRKNPLDELLFIICSIQTNEDLYRLTFANLKAEFPTFDSLARASERQISDSIVVGGLSTQKARAIKKLVMAIWEEFGRRTLAPLKDMTDHECQRFLTSLPGVGLKTARCVMMYSLDRRVFPVDLHCWRICRRIGWVRPTRQNKTCTRTDMDRLQEKIPPELRFRLHVNFVSHGRATCTSADPNCLNCCIRRHCRQIGVGKTSH
jgi:endonuclease III